jgi:hypothetical protein
MARDLRVNQVDKNRDKKGFYPTPRWVTRQFLEHEKFKGTVLEPACGDGRMSKVLIAEGYKVKSSDLYDRGYGKSGVDFLKRKKKAGNIFTNPPYELCLPFILKGLELYRKKLAVIVRLSFLSSKGRWDALYKKTPPSRVYILCKRPSMALRNKKTGKRPNAVDYCWLVWDKTHKGPPEILWIYPE